MNKNVLEYQHYSLPFLFVALNIRLRLDTYVKSNFKRKRELSDVKNKCQKLSATKYNLMKS